MVSYLYTACTYLKQGEPEQDGSVACWKSQRIATAMVVSAVHAATCPKFSSSKRSFSFWMLLLVLSSNTPTDCLGTTQCRAKMPELITTERLISLEWIPSFVGSSVNEGSDIKAKQEPLSRLPTYHLHLTE